MKLFLFIATFFVLSISLTQTVFAREIAAGSSATMAYASYEKKADHRVEILTNYLEAKNSPLKESARTFIEQADKNSIDWKLVVSIAGVESTFGKAIPSNSYNAWGWGVYGDNVLRFSSFDEAITVISKGLKDNYVDKLGSSDVYAIGTRYAASPTWAVRVESFMNSIDKLTEPDPNYSLSLSL